MTLLLSQNIRKRMEYRLALNIEHWIERLGLFVIIILGELVVSVYGISSNSSGFSYMYLDTSLGLLIAMAFQWIYFALLDGYGGRFVHPVRSHRLSGFTWTFLHLPMTFALMAAGVGTGILIKYDPLSHEVGASDLEKKYGMDNVRWLVCGGYAFSLSIMVVLGMLYQAKEGPPIECPLPETTGSPDKSPSSSHGSSLNVPPCAKRWQQLAALPSGVKSAPRCTKTVRLSIRTCVAVIFLIVGGTGSSLSVPALLGTLAVFIMTGAFLEEYGKIRVFKVTTD
jgi:hypothetical protein